MKELGSHLNDHLAAVKLPQLNIYGFKQLQRRAEQIDRVEAERMRVLSESLRGDIYSR